MAKGLYLNKMTLIEFTMNNYDTLTNRGFHLNRMILLQNMESVSINHSCHEIKFKFEIVCH